MRRTAPRSERGAALPTIAIMLVVLLGMAAFAVDLGWLYLNASRLQKTADSAALAGVVNLPSEPAQAEIDALTAANANGFPVGVTSSLVSTPLPDAKHQVDMTTTVNTFFLSVFGMNTVDISKRSTAQYIQPVPMGSPNNCLGRDPTGSRCSGDPGFWAAINGVDTDKWHGDAYTAECWGDETNDDWECDNDNPQHRNGGYWYGIEVFPGTTSLTVDLYDAGWYERTGSFVANSPWDIELSAGGGIDTRFTLRQPDTTPYNPQDNPPQGGGCNLRVNAGQHESTYRDRWANLCAVANPTPGIYVLQVSPENPAKGGVNSFSIAATTSGPQARVYGINDMSLYNTNAGTSATINLAEIEEVHAGKRMVIGLFDSGDADARVSLSILDPSGAIPSCSWTGEGDGGRTGPPGSGPCTIVTTLSGRADRQYNGMWLEIDVAIPSDYSCGSDCWWQVRYDVGAGGSATDRTTWEVAVIGNPVRLVPNAP